MKKNTEDLQEKLAIEELVRKDTERAFAVRQPVKPGAWLKELTEEEKASQRTISEETLAKQQESIARQTKELQEYWHSPWSK